MSNSDPKKLLAHGLHLGHKKNKVHPKAEQFIHSYQRGTSIIDLIQTADLLDEAKKVLEDARKKNKAILVVATKKVARKPVSEMCKAHDIPYMTNKWVGGFLTNFDEIFNNIKRMNEMKTAQSDGSWNSLIKHERINLEKKLNKITSVYGGVANLTKTPDIVVIFDLKKENNARTEARQLGITTIAIADTNVNPEGITHIIPANDDAISSIEFLMEELLGAYIGKTVKAPVEKVEEKVEEKTEETKAPKATAKKPKAEKVAKVDKKTKAAKVTKKSTKKTVKNSKKSTK